MPNVDINGTVVAFPDSLSEDELNKAVSSAAQQMGGGKEPSALDKVKDFANKVIKASATGLQAPIVQLPNQAMGRVSQTMNDLGEAGAVNAAAQGLEPHVAAAAGTLTQMAPDLAATIDPMGGEIRPSLQASKLQARASGLGKMFNQTSSARRQAVKAGATALEQGLTSPLADPVTLNDRIAAATKQTGQALEGARDIGPTSPQSFFDAIDQTKQKVLGNFQGKKGLFSQVSGKFDDLKDTLYDLMPNYRPAQEAATASTGLVDAKGNEITKQIPAQPENVEPIRIADVIKAKKRINDSVNWLAANNHQEDAKNLAMSLEGGIEDAMTQAGSDMPRYRALKSVYGDLKTLSGGLNKELAGLSGGSPVAARSLLMGAIFHGDPIASAAVAGGSELARRRGPGIMANALYAGEKATNSRGINLAAMEAYRRIMGQNK